MSEPKTIPLEVVARIVEDLGRGHRPVSSIAGRHHVPADLVFALRDKYGPEPPKLTEAAKELRRPKAAPVPPEAGNIQVDGITPKRRWNDGLTAANRIACRTWCADNGVWVGSFGTVSGAALDAWSAAGRPGVEPTSADVTVDATDEEVVSSSITSTPEPKREAPTPDDERDPLEILRDVRDALVQRERERAARARTALAYAESALTRLAALEGL